MIYFVFVTSVLAVQNGAVLEMTGDVNVIEFGGALTLIHNTTEDELVCSGKIKATDVLIEGTSTTVADLIGEFDAMKTRMAAIERFVGMMPPPAAPPDLPPPRAPWSDVCSTGFSSSWSPNSGPGDYANRGTANVPGVMALSDFDYPIDYNGCHTWCMSSVHGIGILYAFNVMVDHPDAPSSGGCRCYSQPQYESITLIGSYWKMCIV